MKKGSVIIIVVVILALIVGVGGTLAYQKYIDKNSDPVFLPLPGSETKEVTQNSSTPSPTDETASWKTYTREGKYTFNYPKDWVLENIPEANYEQQHDFSLKSADYKQEVNYDNSGSGVELIIVRSKAEKNTIEEMYDYDRFAGQDESSKTGMIVAGEKAIRYDFGYESTQATNTIFIHNGTYYWVSLRWANTQTKDKYLPTYDQILSTFKFTE